MNIVVFLLFGLGVGFLTYILDRKTSSNNIFHTLFFAIFGSVAGGIVASVLLGDALLRPRVDILLIGASGALIVILASKVLQRI